jgi:hypothetical protein
VRSWTGTKASIGGARDSVAPEGDPRDLLRLVLVEIADLRADVR